MQIRRAAGFVVLALLAGGAAGLFIPHRVLAPFAAPNWQEIAWPFERDAWPKGRAFRCTSSACGGRLEVYLRPKIGLCNCATGVSGDAEVDAVSDVDLMSDDFMPLAKGDPVEFGGMKGISRPYQLKLPGGVVRRAAGMALQHRCDLVAAASLGDAAGTAQASAAFSALIERPDVTKWLLDQMGKS